MLTYALTKTGGVSLYEQLYRRVKDDILTGRLATGEKLPSKRALAAHLEVSVITVKNAYEQLMAEGYIYGMEKKGYYVSPVQRPLTAPAHRQEAAPPADGGTAEPDPPPAAGETPDGGEPAAEAPDDGFIIVS